MTICIDHYNQKRYLKVVFLLLTLSFHHNFNPCCKFVVAFGVGEFSHHGYCRSLPSFTTFVSNNHYCNYYHRTLSRTTPRQSYWSITRWNNNKNQRNYGVNSGLVLFQSSTPQQQKQQQKTKNEDIAKTLGYRTLYPPISANRNGTLSIPDSVHTLYYEEYGVNVVPTTTLEQQDPSSYLTVLFLHGGPGAGCFPNHARFFNPTKYRIILLDQRGCGKSTPRGQVFQQNTLLDLVHDCERLKQHLQISSWDVILGGSWGSTLALAYSQTYPQSVRHLILRGVCTLRPSEINWLFTPNGGAAQIVDTDAWAEFERSIVNITSSSSSTMTTATTKAATTPMPTTASRTTTEISNEEAQQQQENDTGERDVLHAYYNVLLSGDDYAAERLRAAQSWMRYEMRISSAAQDIIAKQQEQQQQKGQQQKKTSRPSPVLAYDPFSNEWCFQDKTSVPLSQSDILDKDVETARNLRKGLAESTPTSPPSSSSLLAYNNNGPRPVEKLTIPPTDTTTLSEKEQQFLSFIPAQTMLTCFYSVNDAFAMNYVNLLLPERMELIKDIPCIAIQGGLDFICPADTALDLLDAWCPSSATTTSATTASSSDDCDGDNSITIEKDAKVSNENNDNNKKSLELRIPIYAGHSMYDPAITNEIVQATDHLASHIQ